MLYEIEPEIQDGIRCLQKTEVLFNGAAKLPRIYPASVSMSWYGTSVSPLRGSFCLVKEGIGLEDLVGEFVRVSFGSTHMNLYCLGQNPSLETDIAIPRGRFLNFALLPTASIDVFIDALI